MTGAGKADARGGRGVDEVVISDCWVATGRRVAVSVVDDER